MEFERLNREVIYWEKGPEGEIKKMKVFHHLPYEEDIFKIDSRIVNMTLEGCQKEELIGEMNNLRRLLFNSYLEFSDYILYLGEIKDHAHSKDKKQVDEVLKFFTRKYSICGREMDNILKAMESLGFRA